MTNDLLLAVRDWKLEAYYEDMSRLFYRFDGFDDILGGKYAFVVGRKGSGKSAIANYIASVQEFDQFVSKIDLSDFPHDEFDQVLGENAANSSAIISAWRFVLLDAVIEMMAHNENIGGEASRILEKIKPRSTESRLEQSYMSYSGGSIGLGIADNPIISGISAKIGTKSKHTDENRFSKRMHAIEKFIHEHADDKKYYILVDHVDTGYDESYNSESMEGKYYWNKVKSLLKAAIKLRQTFLNSKIQILPIIFIPDDIYEQIKDRDKGKWADVKFSLKWRKDALQRMLQFRIGNSCASPKNYENIDTAISAVFDNTEVQLPQKFDNVKSKNIFDYILLRSYMRPRDFISYMKICADSAIRQNPDKTRIPSWLLLASEQNYSEYMREQVVDEVGQILPDISDILGLFDKLPMHRFFTYQDFDVALKSGFEDLNKTPPATNFVLLILYKFSIIGNSRRFAKIFNSQTKTFEPTRYYRTFHYMKPGVSLDLDGDMSLHSSLWVSLFPSRTEMLGNVADSFVNDTDEIPHFSDE